MKPGTKTNSRARHGALALTCAALLVASCGTPGPTAPAPRPLVLDIAAGKIAEQCFKLDKGERIEYQFQATSELDFNLHTHRGGEIVMPVNVERTRQQAGVFTSPGAEDYCMMWTNQHAVPARITGQWRRLR
ncbi:MAG: hypothetical protein ABI831_19315 [Betaproteobacteria bacterium]